MLGMHGTRAANYAMDEADLICAVGARFDDRIRGKLSEFAPRAKFIHIDVDPAEIAQNVTAHIPLVGHAKHGLATCAQNNIPIKVFIMNNGYLGMVRQWQELFWDGKYSHVDMGEFPDFVKLAEAYGVTGMRFTDKTTLVEDMKRAIAVEGPV